MKGGERQVVYGEKEERETGEINEGCVGRMEEEERGEGGCHTFLD